MFEVNSTRTLYRVLSRSFEEREYAGMMTDVQRWHLNCYLVAAKISSGSSIIFVQNWI